MSNEEEVCQSCGFANEANVFFCRKCGFQVLEESQEPERILVLPGDIHGLVPAKKSWGTSCFEKVVIAIVLIIVFIIGSDQVLWRSRRHGYTHSREKACYANMRVILGAIEMYNMDNVNMINTLDDFMATSKDGSLVEQKYLRAPISRPESKCQYSGDHLSDVGQVKCDLHGTVEGDN